MGHHQSHKAQQPREADSGSRQSGGQCQKRQPQLLCREAQAPGGLCAQQKHIQFSGQGKHQQHGHQDDPEGRRYPGHGQIGQTADTKIGIAVQGLRHKGHYRVDPGAENAGDRDTRQHQGDPGRAGPLRQEQHQKYRTGRAQNSYKGN